jgi:hypothetical protein
MGKVGVNDHTSLVSRILSINSGGSPAWEAKMFCHFMRLAAMLQVFLILASCIATSKVNLAQPDHPQATATISVAGTAPVAASVALATARPIATAAAGFDCKTVEEIPTAECEALRTFYRVTGGPQWVNSTGWLASNTPCSWFGVSCISTNVDTLGLFFNRLSGHLPADLVGLTALRVLDLHNNQITGHIPAEFGRLAVLKYMDLSANQLSGSILASLSALKRLQILNLANNTLTGTIPAEFGRLTSLRNFALEHNLLTGTIPESLANLSALESLDLGDNKLVGSIPFELGQLPALSLAILSFNQLTGPEPSSLFELPTHKLWGNQLIYTYQGLASDQKYYIAAVLPITHPSLTADANITGSEPPEFTSDFPNYPANVTGYLNTQASNTYFPDLNQLDAMMSSLEVK